MQAKIADQPDEVFFLSRATLEGFVRGDVPAAAAAAELRANRASYQDQLRVDPPFQHGVAHAEHRAVQPHAVEVDVPGVDQHPVLEARVDGRLPRRARGGGDPSLSLIHI